VKTPTPLVKGKTSAGLEIELASDLATVADFVAGTYCDALVWSCKATHGRYSLQALAHPAHWVQVPDTRSEV
jgi:hypothetical protein